ncbi:MAG: signal peptidase I [Leptolyngbyaceae bacterium]|nr:signal peptidase I [Leptolyngbyaceae bacterium]
MSSSSQRRLNPWIAVNFSVLWPGLGQCYGRAWVKGVCMAIATLALIGYSVWSIFGAPGNTMTGLLLFIVVGVFYIVNVFDAYHTLKPLPKPSMAIYQPKRNRWYAVFLSQILPGFGHLYLQQAIVGGILLASGTLTSLLASHYPELLPIPPFLWAIACYHIYRSMPQRESAHRWVIAAIVTGLLIMRLILGYVPTVVNGMFMQFIVPSSSMAPTLQVNDRMFVRDRPHYHPQMGDVVVFHAPKEAIATLKVDPDTIFVKRVIGLPGQRVAVANGQVSVDDVVLSEPYISQSTAYTWGPVTVPPDAYVVLGDNRNESADSHIWGFLPESDLMGRAYKIYWPPGRIQPLG